jgi:hypothetical protein
MFRDLRLVTFGVDFWTKAHIHPEAWRSHSYVEQLSAVLEAFKERSTCKQRIGQSRASKR